MYLDGKEQMPLIDPVGQARLVSWADSLASRRLLCHHVLCSARSLESVR